MINAFESLPSDIIQVLCSEFLDPFVIARLNLARKRQRSSGGAAPKSIWHHVHAVRLCMDKRLSPESVSHIFRQCGSNLVEIDFRISKSAHTFSAKANLRAQLLLDEICEAIMASSFKLRRITLLGFYSGYSKEAETMADPKNTPLLRLLRALNADVLETLRIDADGAAADFYNSMRRPLPKLQILGLPVPNRLASNLLCIVLAFNKLKLKELTLYYWSHLSKVDFHALGQIGRMHRKTLQYLDICALESHFLVESLLPRQLPTDTDLAVNAADLPVGTVMPQLKSRCAEVFGVDYAKFRFCGDSVIALSLTCGKLLKFEEFITDYLRCHSHGRLELEQLVRLLAAFRAAILTTSDVASRKELVDELSWVLERVEWFSLLPKHHGDLEKLRNTLTQVSKDHNDSSCQNIKYCIQILNAMISRLRQAKLFPPQAGFPTKRRTFTNARTRNIIRGIFLLFLIYILYFVTF